MNTPELTDTTIIHALLDDPDNALLNVPPKEDVMTTLDRLHAELAANGMSDQADALWMRAQMLYRRRKEAGHGQS